MGWAQIAAMLAAATLLAPVAMAQSDRKCADAEFDSHSVPLDDLAPFAGASWRDVWSGGRTCGIITFYRLPAKTPVAASPAEQKKLQSEYSGKVAEPWFAARYVDDKQTRFKPRWTDQDRCPSLVVQLKKLEPILAPKLTGPGPYRDVGGSLTDEAITRFWLSTQIYPQSDPNYTMDLTIDGGSPLDVYLSGSPTLGSWLEETFKALDACWSAEAPVIK